MSEPKSASMDEKSKQEEYPWARGSVFAEYNAVLGRYQAQACLEHSRGKSLLDIACGDGLLTSMLCERFERVVGVDASSKHLAEAKKRLPQVEFKESLVEDFETGERFDTVSMLNILEHVADPGLVLKKGAEFTSDDGVLIVHVPNAEAINRKIAVAMGTLNTLGELSPFDRDIVGHRRSYTTDTLVEEVQSAGLKVVATGGVFYKMLSTAQMDWFLANGPWEEGGFGWGRVGAEPRDWRAEFCRACYEIGKQYPRECNIIYAVIAK